MSARAANLRANPASFYIHLFACLRAYVAAHRAFHACFPGIRSIELEVNHRLIAKLFAFFAKGDDPIPRISVF